MRSVLLLMLSMAAVAVAAERSASASNAPGRIVEVVGESGDAGPSPRLIVMDADGTNARLRLNWVTGASLSPDGRSVAYAFRTTPTEIRVVAVDAVGRGRRLVVNAFEPDWSPTGAAIAFTRGARGQPGIWTADLTGRHQRLVAPNGSHPDWSPDGRQLAFSRGRDIWVVDVRSKASHRVIRNGRGAQWSPEGRRIAFIRDRGPVSDVYVANADGTGRRRVAEGYGAVWSPDGRELAACSGLSVIRVRADGTGRELVRRGPWCDGLDWRG